MFTRDGSTCQAQSVIGIFNRLVPGLAVILAGVLPTPSVLADGGGWVTFVNETATRLSSSPELGVNDPEEKDYAWADVDKDGDVDLVVVRKEPFSNSVGKRNVLFMNEGGVLIDRTNLYALAATDGGQGFLDLTPDRDVVLIDVNNDTWLDIVTGPAGAYEPGIPKTISHPRIYINLKDNPPGSGIWQGFRYEESRIPLITPTPNFCGIGADDVTGDGRPDLYFTDYTNSLENRLLINNGTGTFSDATVARTFSDMNNASFSPHAVIADMNGDNARDIIVDHALGPYRIGIAYNNPANIGFFDVTRFDQVYGGSPYFVSVGDLNNDTRPDLVITDDGADSYQLNQGNDVDGFAILAQCGSCTFPNSVGFGSQSAIYDLNKDGWKDVLISDIDVDIQTCGSGRYMHIYRNNTNPPDVTFTHDLGGIPSNMLLDTFHVAVFDINGDTWLDLVVGRCNSTEVWISDPPISLLFSYPSGVPDEVTPGSATQFGVVVTGSGATPQPGTGKQFVSVNGGVFVQSNMTQGAPNNYTATIPAQACTSQVRFYFSSDVAGGGTVTDPLGAPNDAYQAIASYGTSITMDERFETANPGWTVSNTGLTTGAWTRVNPVGTFFPTGSQTQAQPEDDFGAPVGETQCYVTQQSDDAVASNDDVDGGPTTLTSSVIDLAGTNAIVSFAWWHFSSTGVTDTLFAEVTNNGSTWVVADQTSGTSSQWQARSFRVSDFVTPTADVRVRFRVADQPNDSTTESAIDDFKVTEFICTAGCSGPGDCQDALYCNGAENCVANECVAGSDPCPGQSCDEGMDQCVECLKATDCDDHLYCNGAESCAAGSCAPGTSPCSAGLLCDETSDTCAECFDDEDCDDGDFCNGEESCASEVCVSAATGVQNGGFDSPSGWTDHLLGDGTISYASSRLTVVGRNDSNNGTVWSGQSNVDLDGANLQFDLFSYSSPDTGTFDYPVFHVDGTFYGLDADGTLGPVSTCTQAGSGTISNANEPTNVHFSINVEAIAGAGTHEIGFGVCSTDGIASPGTAVFDTVIPSAGPIDPCPGQLCDPVAGCTDCLPPGCDDGVACTTDFCIVLTHACTNTPNHALCDDGLYCNGVETCDSVNDCQNGTPPCGVDEDCIEADDACAPLERRLQPIIGDPLDDLTAEQVAMFLEGKDEFEDVKLPSEGLGPIFNKDSCAGCHSNPVGGSGTILERRFGLEGKGTFDPLEHLGGSLLQDQAISPNCFEIEPEQPVANVSVDRVTNSAIGAGLVEAIPDAGLAANEGSPPPGISGRAHMVGAFEDPMGAPLRVGRFGWKAQQATVLSFSVDATLNELGITSRFLPDENDPNGVNPPSLGPPNNCDTVADPEDPAGVPIEDSFIGKITVFQRLLAPPPQTPRSGMAGEALFVSVGCADCHVPTFVTANDADLEQVLRNRTIHPYSDFLLHDMGALGDGIVQGDAGASEIRTPSLWGLRVRDPILHDGRVQAGTFEERILRAVAWHCSLGGEARDSAQAFLNGTIPPDCGMCPSCPAPDSAGLGFDDAQRDAVVAFLDSLGRAEFDHDGDNDVDGADFAVFQNCVFTGGPDTPDQPCAISDFDQDGFVNCADWMVFQEAWTGPPATPPHFSPCDGAIPTISQWGATSLALLFAGAGTIVFARRNCKLA